MQIYTPYIHIKNTYTIINNQIYISQQQCQHLHPQSIFPPTNSSNPKKANNGYHPPSTRDLFLKHQAGTISLTCRDCRNVLSIHTYTNDYTFTVGFLHTKTRVLVRNSDAKILRAFKKTTFFGSFLWPQITLQTHFVPVKSKRRPSMFNPRIPFNRNSKEKYHSHRIFTLISHRWFYGNFAWNW